MVPVHRETDVTPMKYTIDWISGTNGKVRDAMELAGFARQVTGAKRLKEAKGMYGYKVALKDDYGILFESGARADMGTHIQASGLAMNSLMLRFDAWKRLMKMIEVIKPARIDLAVDTTSDFAGTFAKALEDGQIRTKAGSWSVIRSDKGGLTAYVGSRSSDRFLRVYNKAREQNISDMAWTRIELECKGAAAIDAKGVIMSHGVADTCKSWIRGFADCDIPEWRQAFDGKAVYWKSPKGSTNTRRWLLDTCAPAMKRLIQEGDDDLFSDFSHLVFDD